MRLGFRVKGLRFRITLKEKNRYPSLPLGALNISGHRDNGMALAVLGDPSLWAFKISNLWYGLLFQPLSVVVRSFVVRLWEWEPYPVFHVIPHRLGVTAQA